MAWISLSTGQTFAAGERRSSGATLDDGRQNGTGKKAMGD
jgi:hypothetical protein